MFTVQCYRQTMFKIHLNFRPLSDNCGLRKDHVFHTCRHYDLIPKMLSIHTCECRSIVSICSNESFEHITTLLTRKVELVLNCIHKYCTVDTPAGLLTHLVLTSLYAWVSISKTTLVVTLCAIANRFMHFCCLKWCDDMHM